MVEWHHRLDGHEFGQTPGDGEGQGSLAHVDTKNRTEQLNNKQQLIPEAGRGAQSRRSLGSVLSGDGWGREQRAPQEGSPNSRHSPLRLAYKTSARAQRLFFFFFPF